MPVFLKLAPDLDEAAMDAIAEVIAEPISMASSSPTPPSVAMPSRASRTPAKLAAFPANRCSLSPPAASPRCASASAPPIIGVGGIHSPASALAKFEAGANAIQLYTALVFGGLDLLDRIKRGLVAAVRAEGKANIAEFVGRKTDKWARGEV